MPHTIDLKIYLFIIYAILFDMEKMGKKIENIENVDVWGKHSHKGKYTHPSYSIKKVLELELPSITVNEIPKDISIEYTPVFRRFLQHFNKAHGTNSSVEDLLYSSSSYNGFMRFVMVCIVKRFLIIDRKCENDFMMRVEKLYNTYVENQRSLILYYDEIIRTIYKPKYGKQNQRVRDEMDYFEKAYTFTKTAFQKDKRDSWERTFEHPKGVMEIVLRELPNPGGTQEKPCVKKPILALLHDVIETFPEYADVIRKEYGDEMANRVNKLSKKRLEIIYNRIRKRGLLTRFRRPKNAFPWGQKFYGQRTYWQSIHIRR